uniref:Uncharacterized protein n=1 Tax=Panagrolaimus superbus TaxID=310955 RepID=A0A914Z9T8_9BILA
MSNKGDAEPDFSLFQEPAEVLDDFVSSPLPTSAAFRMYNRMQQGKITYKRKSLKTSTPPPPLPSQSSQSTYDDENSDDDGPDNTFDDAFTYPTPEEPPNNEEAKKEKSLNRWIFEEILAFFVCIIYMIGFNILVKLFL